MNIDELEEGQLKAILSQVNTLDPTLLRLAIAEVNQRFMDTELAKANQEIEDLRGRLDPDPVLDSVESDDDEADSNEKG